MAQAIGVAHRHRGNARRAPGVESRAVPEGRAARHIFQIDHPGFKAETGSKSGRSGMCFARREQERHVVTVKSPPMRTMFSGKLAPVSSAPLFET